MADLGWCSKHELVGEDDSSCCSKCWAEIKAEVAARKRAVEDALRAEGREEERRDVVAWLRSNARQGGDDEHEQSCAEADDIEAGDHVGAAKKEGA